MENKICPIKTGMENQTVYCTNDCGYYCEAGNNTKCALAIAEDVKAAKLWEAYKVAGKLRQLLGDIK